ncbi:hypothetical protein ACFVU3_22100 [Streptomyces sp. NPDC058052]
MSATSAKTASVVATKARSAIVDSLRKEERILGRDEKTTFLAGSDRR